MPAWLANLEPAIRLSAFIGVFAAMALAELFWPWRAPAARRRRWAANIGIVVIDTLLVRIAFPVAAVGAALWAEGQSVGLLRWLGTPGWVALPVGLLLLDLAIYLQHRAFHAVPWLWRLHRMHHADTEFDATTGLRFHPLEILLSMAIKIAIVIALGLPAAAVLIFEVLLSATSLFSHGNLRLPSGIETGLRRVLVTPDMHRVHHSVVRAETDSNFGFCLAVWDRIFGTYRAEPAAGRDAVAIGLPVFRDPEEQRLDRLLSQPFRD